ncbi:hypothetical protein AB6A40_000214 [Gnathostoma spinigerum]|uniref:Secreted protein n=1 Tax=Gnathostoma spinigerum TaxID=75299 RepID=A0ABD6E1M4_9BILA
MGHRLRVSTLTSAVVLMHTTLTRIGPRYNYDSRPMVFTGSAANLPRLLKLYYTILDHPENHETFAFFCIEKIIIYGYVVRIKSITKCFRLGFAVPKSR